MEIETKEKIRDGIQKYRDVNRGIFTEVDFENFIIDLTEHEILGESDRKNLTFKSTIRSIKKLEKKSRLKGYNGDATELAFRHHVLLLLSEIRNGLYSSPSEKEELEGGK